MKLTKDINYSIVIFFSIFLIFMDAYEFFSIPVSWIGMSLLFLISLFEYKDLFNENVKHILIIVMSIVLIPQIFYLLFFESTNSDLSYIFLRIYNLVSFVFVLFFTIHYLQKENLNLFFKFTRYFIFIFSVATIYIFLAQIFDLYEHLPIG